MTNLITRSNGFSTRLAAVLGLVATLSFSGISGLELWRMGDVDYRHHQNAATNLIASIASEIDRNIELYDLSLQAVVDGIKLPDIDTIRPELRQVVLFDRAASARDLGSILVLDAAGDVRLDSRSLTPPRANFADRDFFKIHLTNADAGTLHQPPLGDARWTIPHQVSAAASAEPTGRSVGSSRQYAPQLLPQPFQEACSSATRTP